MIWRTETLVLLMALVLGAGGMAPALAHDLDLVLRADQRELSGQLRYSDDTPAGGNFVRVSNLSDPDIAVLALQTDAEGRFRLTAVPGHRYEVTVEGDEGHSTASRIELPGRSWPPVYMILGLLLLLSLLPAWWLQRRKPHDAG